MNQFAISYYSRKLFRPFFIPILLLLAACSRAVPATPVAVVNTAVPTPTITAETTEIVGTMEVETAVSVTPSITSTRIRIPTLTPVPTFTPAATPGAPLPAGTVVYQLHEPSADALINVFREVARYEDAHPESAQLGGRFQGYQYLNQFIQVDLERFFPEEIPNAINVLNDEFFRARHFGLWEPSLAQIRILNNGFQQYLNLHQVRLTSGVEVENSYLRFTPFIIELDGDSFPEWIVQANYQIFGDRSILLIDEDEHGQYSILSGSFPYLTAAKYSATETTVDASFEFTNDGIHEVIVTNYAYIGGYFRYFIEIYTWKNTQLELLQEIDLSYDTAPPAYDIADYTGDGVEDVRVLTSHPANFGCEWEQIDIYSWQGLQSQHQFSDGTPPDEPYGLIPDTPLCNVWKAMIPFGRIGYVPMAEKIPLLERALAELSLETAPSADYLAFIRFHLAMAYFSQGRDAEARYLLNTVYELSDESSYAQIVKTQDELANGSWLDLCRGLLTTAQQIIPTDLSRYINEGALGDIGSTELHDPYLCPLREVITNRLQSIPLLAQHPPVSLLAEQNLELTVAQSVDLDGDIELEWMGILEIERPTLVIFDAVQGNWEVHFVAGLIGGKILNLAYDSLDLTGDAIPELLVSVDSTDLVEHRVLLIELAQNEFREISEQAVLLDETMTLSQLTADDFFYPRSPHAPPGWFYLENFPTDEAYISDYVWHLVNELLAEERPFSLPADLTTLITYLPADDPEAQPVINQLTYMLGYYYELEGQNQQAITTYLQLIQQAPNSPWSWLAWARLEPISE